MYDIFFISYNESNCEDNWQNLLTLHPAARRIKDIQGIDRSHMECNQLSTTEKFWTIDGDNWLLQKLPIDITVNHDLIFFNSKDPIDGVISSMGGVKLWTKNKIINPNMSKGDFCKNATRDSIVIQKTISEHRYNATPYETWRCAFRHAVKALSGIITKKVLEDNILKFENQKLLDDGRNNAMWSYRGYLDAKEYVEVCNGDFNKINYINDYDWLKSHFKKYEKIK